MMMGAAAGEGWERVVRLFGVGGALLFVALAVAVWWLWRRRLRRRKRNT